MDRLKRTLRLTEVVFFGVGSVLGAGIYALIGKMAGHGGYLLWASFLVASLAALATAFSYAELSSAFPHAGGEYVYGKKAIGKKFGAFLGLTISLCGTITGATVAIGFAGYLSSIANLPQRPGVFGILLFSFVVNISGIKQSSVVNILLTLVETGGLLFVIFCSAPDFGKIDFLQFPEEGFSGVMIAASLSFFAFLGFEKIVKLGEETVSPERTIPKALFISGLIVTFLYLAVAIGAISVLPPEEIKDSSHPIADVVSSRFGKGGAIVISVIALFSTANTVLANMLSSSRVILNMGREIKFLEKFSTISRGRKTPVAALILVLLFMACFALIGKIEVVALTANFFMFLIFLSVNLSVILLRVSKKNLKRPYRIPGAIRNIPLISVAGILLTLLLLYFTILGLADFQ